MDTPVFHRLQVAQLEQLTEDSVAVTLAVPDHLADQFSFLPGQHVTMRAMIDGQDIRRSYSICTNANTGSVRVGIKHLAGGLFSTWANTQLQQGDFLEVMPPVGDFTIEAHPDRSCHYLAIAAGSGITPILSLISTVLDVEDQSRFTLIFGNRETRTIMFLEELEGIKDRFPDRFHLIHVLSREPQLVELFHGRIDADRLESLFGKVVDAQSVDAWYLCGPYRMVKDLRTFLLSRGVAADVIHDELFFDGDPPPLPATPIGAGQDKTGWAQVSFTLDGRASTVLVDPAGPPILDHALSVRRELPFACKGGVCATCKAHLVEGEIRMDQNWALVAEEVERGLVLTCQAHPVSQHVVLDYDI